MNFSTPVRSLHNILSYSLLLCFTIISFVSFAQEVKKSSTANANWQANLKRMYMFTDINDAKANNFDYTTEGKFSIRSIANNHVIFTGENINKNDPSVHLTSRSVFIIDPIGKAESKKKENVIAAAPEIELPKKDFSVYPNPINNSQKEITLGLNDFEDGKEIQVSLFDGTGRVVNQQSFTLKDKHQSVAIPQLPSGMYFVKVTEKDNQYSKKLLVR